MNGCGVCVWWISVWCVCGVCVVCVWCVGGVCVVCAMNVCVVCAMNVCVCRMSASYISFGPRKYLRACKSQISLLGLTDLQTFLSYTECPHSFLFTTEHKYIKVYRYSITLQYVKAIQTNIIGNRTKHFENKLIICTIKVIIFPSKITKGLNCCKIKIYFNFIGMCLAHW